MRLHFADAATLASPLTRSAFESAFVSDAAAALGIERSRVVVDSLAAVPSAVGAVAVGVIEFTIFPSQRIASTEAGVSMVVANLVSQATSSA
jgi:hypothetical protein